MAKPAKTATEAPQAAEQPDQQLGPVMKFFKGPAKWADDRTGVGGIMSGRIPNIFNLRKVFPDHWSFMLGEIALYSFVVLLLTGVFLTLWFKPSMGEIEYNGSYQLLRGLPMSEAYASTLNISFDVRGGLLIRQIHHWAALLFIASMLTHSMRIFFTGGFRKPREINWVIGATLLFLGMTEGFLGYSIPDDLLSGVGVRIIFGAVLSIPLVGTYLETWFLGGEYPGDILVPRMYMLHILLIPAVILALVAVHLVLIFYHKHTQFPGQGRTEKNVVGYPFFPVYTAKAGGFFFIVFGVIVLMAALIQINPIWVYGPYNPAEVSAGSQPDWYIGYLEGALRLMPNWEWHIGPTTWSWNIFIPAILGFVALPGAIGVYPFLEKWVSGDDLEHHVLDRPRNAPNRTAIGVAGITVYVVLMIGGANDIIATHFHISLNAITLTLRWGIFILPIITFMITKRICIGLQRAAYDRVLHGSESGVIHRSPAGGYSEPHTPITQGEAYTITQHHEYQPLTSGPQTDENGVARRGTAKERARRPFTRWYYGHNVPKPTAAEVEEARHHQGGHEVEGGHDDHAIESGEHSDEQVGAGHSD
ncbi:cytochrome bc1 complex cytochrome b subunit [Microlunatus endophyticus]|uniref:Cytochrome bc1 complex cytochrome b subunit n=1 Tax=Microlunatus endophyticus TaxID=1716077 RepID=A0A917S091_9ACTN|nr:cytochrome bc complex cytochrome b subunit [Microlunatus endophyticus]GGL48500.1 cytochrome bc1 complex cytochrome b subunit [Microlunatus endophyticus]